MFSGFMSQCMIFIFLRRASACSSCFVKYPIRLVLRPRSPFCWSSWSRLTPSCSKTRHRWFLCQKDKQSWTMSARGSAVPPPPFAASGGSRNSSSRRTSISACFRNATRFRITLSANAFFRLVATRKTCPKVPCPRAPRTSKETLEPSPPEAPPLASETPGALPASSPIMSPTETTRSPNSLSLPLLAARVGGWVRTRLAALSVGCGRDGSTAAHVRSSCTVAAWRSRCRTATAGGGGGGGTWA